MFAEGVQPNETIGATAEADLLFARDVMSGNQFLLCGKDVLEPIAAANER